MKLCRWIVVIGCAACTSVGPREGEQEVEVLPIGPGAEVRYSEPWTMSAVSYSNAQELVVTREVRTDAEGVPLGQASAYVLARVLITSEPRTSAEDAVRRLGEIAAARDESARFVEIGGWPAVEVEFKEPIVTRGQRAAQSAALVQRAIIAIAMEQRLYHFDGSLGPDAPPGLLPELQTIARSSRFPSRGREAEVQETLRRLREADAARRSRRPEPPQDPASGDGLLDGATPTAFNTGAVSVQAGVGELEIAASANANDVVIASNQALSFSTNRGVTFAAGTTGVFGLNDPSLARGASGNFYLGVIAFPTGTAAQLGVTGCTNAVSRSTNRGANFALRGYSAQCPLTGTGLCFPDQEHIAADVVNTAAGGNDQLYAVWSNMTPAAMATNCGQIGTGFVTASISCSQNGGANWTARAAVPGAGFWPRVAVARDGRVYVVTINGNNVLLNRFTSCANGLTAEAGFPVTVATLSGAVSCPVPGLDRCNDGNTLSSPTVAPDPDNAARVFVSFAESDGSGGERIVTLVSTNSGTNFARGDTVSGGPSARRYLPWSCSTRGRSWVGWYDRRATTAAGTTNDLTEYFVGSAWGSEWNLSRNPDPQCASGWPCAPRSTNDSESCSIQPQLAGRCQRPGGGGSGTFCDFSAGGCPAGETCQGGGGCPKYGDYNGLACAGNWVFAAWASATTPAGLPPQAGLRVYSERLFVGLEGAPIWRYTGTPCNGDSCPGWLKLDNNAKTVAIAAGAGRLYQLHDDGWIWQHTGTPCVDDSCPGWRRLDNNPKTVAIAAGGDQLYQLHNDGWIWRHTGVPCTGNSCPGWQQLDINPKTVDIAAGPTELYQLHNDGWIFRYTGTPCRGAVCSGWQRLDINPKTVAIAVGGDQLYQLHNDGWIFRYTGAPCPGPNCSGWQRLDKNPKTVAIAAGGDQLYQLHNDGWIWRFTGTACTGDVCPGWQRLDNNSKAVAIAASSTGLYQLHNDGWIWRYTGIPCSGDVCPGWQRLDNNARTGMVTAGNELFQLHTAPLYQLHNDGWIWRYTGTECDGDFCPGWQRLDNNSRTRDVIAAGTQVFQRHQDGRIWRYTGTPCAGDVCPGWQMLDNNPRTRAIAAAGVQLFQLHDNGRIWRYTGIACNGDVCPGWQMLDNNPRTRAIAAAGVQLFQLHDNGQIWRHTGIPCDGEVCPGWQMLDNNPATRAIVAGGNQLYQLHGSGQIWRFTGTPCSGGSCPGWQMLDNNARARAIVAAGNQLFQLHDNGQIWRYTGTPCSGGSCPGWQRLDNNSRTVAIAASGNQLYQLHNDGLIWRYVGPPCTGDSCPGWRRLDNNPKTTRLAVGGF